MREVKNMLGKCCLRARRILLVQDGVRDIGGNKDPHYTDIVVIFAKARSARKARRERVAMMVRTLFLIFSSWRARKSSSVPSRPFVHLTGRRGIGACRAQDEYGSERRLRLNDLDAASLKQVLGHSSLFLTFTLSALWITRE
eukprot:SAG11_NODE_1004_length_6210_cov_14.226150_3_plen_142_part_00